MKFPLLIMGNVRNCCFVVVKYKMVDHPGIVDYFSTVSLELLYTCTAQKLKFSIKDFFSKCYQIRSFMRIWSYLLKKSLRENFIFCAVLVQLVFQYPESPSYFSNPERHPSDGVLL